MKNLFWNVAFDFIHAIFFKPEVSCPLQKSNMVLHVNHKLTGFATLTFNYLE